MVGGVTDQDRRSQLLAVKLRALVGDHVGRSIDAETELFPHGAALVDDGAAWVLFDGDVTNSLGAALVWAIRRDVDELHLIGDHRTGDLARRAAGFSLPVHVWYAEGRSLLPAIAVPLAPPPGASPDHLALVELIEQAGATPNVEHGVVVGEVRGLEVCRVVDQPTTGFFDEALELEQLAARHDPGGVRLEVGVGAADREAFQLLHGEVPTLEALADVVRAVESHRTVGSPQHPLNRLGIERLLRWHAEQDPSLVGLESLAPAEPPLPRRNLKDPTPCVGRGRDAAGTEVTVVFTSGVDLDALPYVVDVQSTAPGPVKLALPQRDRLPVVERLAALLVEPVEIVALDVST